MPKIYKRHCNTCGKYYKGQGKKYCSHKCRQPWNKGLKGFMQGIPKSEEHKKKISDSNKGKHEYLRGRKDSIETRHKKSIAFSGSNNPMYGKFRELSSNWRGGLTNIGLLIRTCCKYNIWRKSIFERDNYTCQCCGNKSTGNIEAHHSNKRFIDIIRNNKITTINEAFQCNELWDINNGITLCEECHKKFKK